MKRILSIDWDYFMDMTSKQEAILFPDMPNDRYPYDLQNLIWGTRYADNQELFNIPVNAIAMENLRRILVDNFKVPCVIAESHKVIYELVCNVFDLGDAITVYNIDRHHDCYDNDDAYVNCGNWGNFIMKDFNHPDSHFYWFSTDCSDDYKSPNEEWFTEIKADHSFSMLKDIPFDYIFICKSNMWSPPHLDDKFEWLFRRNVHPLTIIQKDIFESRMPEVLEIYEPFKETMDKVRKDFKNKI